MVLQVIRVFRDVEICEKDLALYLRYFPPTSRVLYYLYSIYLRCVLYMTG